ncbi:MAG: hypothetical protein QOC96_3087 [Acidobacteriota bacterium]|jgi:hypothetical protein|nr:hypothetical protein [Acidobacteriota bacterium]
MRKTIQIFLLLGLFYFVAGETFAQCSCVAERRDITPHKEFKLADAVFIGKVIEIKKTAPDKDTGGYIETVKFEVKKAWKQDLDTLVTIQNKIQGCINGFDENEEWLVYAYKKQDGTFGTYCCCSRTRLLSKAAEDLKEFESEGEQPAKIRQPRK